MRFTSDASKRWISMASYSLRDLLIAKFFACVEEKNETKQNKTKQQTGNVGLRYLYGQIPTKVRWVEPPPSKKTDPTAAAAAALPRRSNPLVRVVVDPLHPVGQRRVGLPHQLEDSISVGPQRLSVCPRGQAVAGFIRMVLQCQLSIALLDIRRRRARAGGESEDLVVVGWFPWA